ncbi:MAG: monovalent cation/H(+) antiporter subunit G [Clostridia bacterium]|nr:monovalent cation/H(+) antiporter subunit G [Clostridia bacterium]
MLEYIRQAVFAFLLLAGLVIQITAVIGVNRFRFSLNRLHPAGMADTLGLLLMALAAAVYAGFDPVTLKIFFIILFFWITSPVCSHLLGRLIRETDEKHYEAEAKEWKP